jgi:hypothetical protein
MSFMGLSVQSDWLRVVSLWAALWLHHRAQADRVWPPLEDYTDHVTGAPRTAGVAGIHPWADDRTLMEA